MAIATIGIQKKMSLAKRLDLKRRLRGHLGTVALYAGVHLNTVCNNLKHFIDTGEWHNQGVVEGINKVLEELEKPSASSAEISLSQKMLAYDDEE